MQEPPVESLPMPAPAHPDKNFPCRPAKEQPTVREPAAEELPGATVQTEPLGLKKIESFVRVQPPEQEETAQQEEESAEEVLEWTEEGLGATLGGSATGGARRLGLPGRAAAAAMAAGRFSAEPNGEVGKEDDGGERGISPGVPTPGGEPACELLALRLLLEEVLPERAAAAGEAAPPWAAAAASAAREVALQTWRDHRLRQAEFELGVPDELPPQLATSALLLRWVLAFRFELSGGGSVEWRLPVRVRAARRPPPPPPFARALELETVVHDGGGEEASGHRSARRPSRRYGGVGATARPKPQASQARSRRREGKRRAFPTRLSPRGRPSFPGALASSCIASRRPISFVQS